MVDAARRFAVCFAFVCLFLTGIRPAAADDLLEVGETVAKQHCARCHVIGAFNRMGGIGSTPSFKLLRKRDDWEERYTSFYARLPHPSFVRIKGVEPRTNLPPNAAPIELSEREVQGLMAYVREMPVN